LGEHTQKRPRTARTAGQFEPTKLARHVRAHKNLDARLRKSERADGSWVYEIRREVYDSETGKSKRVYETVGTRLDQAKARLAEVTTADHQGARLSSLTLTFAEAVKGWRETRQMRPRSIETYDALLRLYIEPRWSGVRLREITKRDYLVWRNSLKPQNGRTKPLAPKYVGLIQETMAVVLDHAVEIGALHVNPLRRLGRKHRLAREKLPARILEGDEGKRLLGACGRFPWLAPMIQTALLAALRLGEVCGLQWRDVDFEAGTITVERQYGKDGHMGPPKGGKSATIPLLPELRALLVGLATLEQSPDDPIFPNMLGGHRQPGDLQRAFVKARTYAKLTTDPRPLRFHDLRHSAISHLANEPGAILPQVQEFARHADLATTYGYVHKTESKQWAASASSTLATVFS